MWTGRYRSGQQTPRGNHVRKRERFRFVAPFEERRGRLAMRSRHGRVELYASWHVEAAAEDNRFPGGEYGHLVQKSPRRDRYSSSFCRAIFRGLCRGDGSAGFLTLIKDADDHTLVGFKLKGFRHTINKLSPAIELSDHQFLVLVSVIEKIFTSIGASVFKEDGKRKAAYQAA
jgi:hypothetical protein